MFQLAVVSLNSDSSFFSSLRLKTNSGTRQGDARTSKDELFFWFQRMPFIYLMYLDVYFTHHCVLFTVHFVILVPVCTWTWLMHVGSSAHVGRCDEWRASTQMGDFETWMCAAKSWLRKHFPCLTGILYFSTLGQPIGDHKLRTLSTHYLHFVSSLTLEKSSWTTRSPQPWTIPC